MFVLEPERVILGLLGSLVLSKHGIPVALMDMGQGLDPNLRPTHYLAPAVS